MMSGTMKNLLKWTVTLLLAASVFLIPTGELFTTQLQLFFAITILFVCVLAFEFMPAMVPSMLLTIFYVVTGLAPVSVALSPWTNTTIYMVIGAFALAAAMEECELLNRICYWFIVKIGGTFNRVCYAIYFVGLILSFVTFTNHFLIVAVFAYAVAHAMGYTKLCKESGVIMFAGVLGATTTSYWIYNPGVIGIYLPGMQSVYPAAAPTWLGVTLQSLPLAIMPVIVMFVVLKITKSKEFDMGNGKAEFLQKLQALGPVSKAEKICCVILLALIAYVLLQPLHGQNFAYGFMLLPWLLYFPQFKITTAQTLSKINFPLVFFMVACMSIGTVGVNLGLDVFAGQLLINLVGDMPAVGVHFLVLVIVALGNIVLTPYAMAGALSAPLTALALSLGLNPEAIMLTFLTGADIFFFPHEIAVLVAIFSFGLISMKDFIKYATIKTAIGLIFFLLIQFPYWLLLGIIYL